MEETTVTTTQNPEIYFPKLKKPFNFKILIYILLGLFLFYIVIQITTCGDVPSGSKELKEQTKEMEKSLDSLRKSRDSILIKNKEYEEKIKEIDSKIDNVKSNKTIINQYYRDKIEKSKTANKQELDTFYKNRYNY